MNSRRQFLLKGSLAATAFLAAKPMKAFSGFSTPLLKAVPNPFQVSIIQSAGNILSPTILRNKHIQPSLYLVHEESAATAYSDSYPLPITRAKEIDSYKIITHNKIKVGIIAASKNEHGFSERANRLSGFLKNKKGCQLVICMSDLGFNNKKAINDQLLAAQSQDIDIIVGKQTEQTPKHPFILLNKSHSEVILQYAQHVEEMLSTINIGFNTSGEKISVSF